MKMGRSLFSPFGAAALILALSTLTPGGAFADGGGQPSFGGRGGSASAKLYQEAVDEIEEARYEKAIKLLKKARRRDKGNPDILNLLGFSERKRGNLDSAFSYYKRALDLRPTFPEAREYLGEAHIDAALRELALLRSYGEDGKRAHAKLLEAFKRAAAGSDGDADAAGPPGSW